MSVKKENQERSLKKKNEKKRQGGRKCPAEPRVPLHVAEAYNSERREDYGKRW